MTSQATLAIVSDDDFARMSAGAPALANGVALPADGVETNATLAYLRALAARLERDWRRAAWGIVADEELVGLIGCKAPPDAARSVEIGYGVAASRRGRGHATAAVGRLVALATASPDIDAVRAETLPENVASHRVLERNGFARVGTRVDPSDGELILWRRATRR